MEPCMSHESACCYGTSVSPVHCVPPVGLFMLMTSQLSTSPSPLATPFCFCVSDSVSLLPPLPGTGTTMGTQVPSIFRSYPTGQMGNGIVCPSASFVLKGGVVVNTAVNIVIANTAAITILFCFNTLYL